MGLGARTIRFSLVTLLPILVGTSGNLHGGDVPVKLPDGTVIKVEVGNNGMPEPVKTPLFTVDTVGMLLDAKDEVAIWTIGGNVKANAAISITIEPLLMPGTKVETEGKPGERFSFHGWDSDHTPSAWAWLDDPGVSYIPMRVTGANLVNGQSDSTIACGAFDPTMKNSIKKWIEWGGTKISYTLPDGSFREIPIRKGKILYRNYQGYRVDSLSVSKFPEHGWVWSLKLTIHDPEATKLILSSPLDSHWKLEEPINKPGELQVRFAPLEEGGPMWQWLKSTGDTFIPLQVEVLKPEGSIGLSTEWAVGNDIARMAVRPKP